MKKQLNIYSMRSIAVGGALGLMLMACGILFGVNIILGIATLSTWIIVAVFLRYSSLAALAAAIFGPIYFVFLFGFQPMGIALLAVCLLLIWRHRSNIRNLMNGTESRIGSKKDSKQK
jgi:glycerol-3-phosphate acyltransferase PlsY